jgi:arylsulfatase A-like enzyme
MREPFIARFPGKIPPGRVNDSVISTLDVLPTVTHLTGAHLPEKPLDGIDIRPILSGTKSSLEREAMLYFDNWNLQCARLGPWKLHISRYNVMAYNPAPAGGRLNLPLKHPELYHLPDDPEESYDVAPEHPEIVAEIQDRIGKLVKTFPGEVQKAYADTMARTTRDRPAAALPAPAPK